MKEHKHKRHRRTSRERGTPEPPRKISRRSPSESRDADPPRKISRRSPSESRDDEVRHHRKKHHHHHEKHSHLPDESRRDYPKSRHEREREQGHEKRRDNYHDKERRPVDNLKIKEERDSDDDRAAPSSSKWDDESDRGGRFRPGFGDDRGGRGGRGRGSRGGRGGRGRGGGPGRSKFFPKEEEDTSNMEWGKKTDNSGPKPLPPEERDKPNFGLSGKLTEDTNTYKGIVIKYSEPPEARVPKRRWRLYPFKGDEQLKVLHLHRASAYLMGRERKVVDIPLDHPSCSKQHAALQFRLVQYNKDDGTVGRQIRPYIIDLESANGTYVNNNKIEPKKYVELLERDVLKFGYSSREYVLLHDNSKGETEDDNVAAE